MSGFTNFIVIMWFLPVVVYIVIPLTMLCGWVIVKLGIPKVTSKRSTEKLENKAAGSNLFTKATA